MNETPRRALLLLALVVSPALAARVATAEVYLRPEEAMTSAALRLRSSTCSELLVVAFNDAVVTVHRNTGNPALEDGYEVYYGKDAERVLGVCAWTHKQIAILDEAFPAAAPDPGAASGARIVAQKSKSAATLRLEDILRTNPTNCR